ncbi:hypothetical protein [Synechocystis sp. LKSZ1]|uniref:hypothetical protein n=1 Tax=Synechocystis sp. LKSZ1 TaxID=3144951 RepID=UPI00336BBE47
MFNRLQSVKRHFNVSAVCQRSLEQAIHCQELKHHLTEQDGLVERLRSEKQVLLHTVWQEGFELGIRSSSKLSYENFRHFERVNPIAKHLDEDVLDYLWTFLDLKAYPQQARLHDPDFAYLLESDAQSRIVFAQAWLEGVLSVWQTIKEQVDLFPSQS